MISALGFPHRSARWDRVRRPELGSGRADRTGRVAGLKPRPDRALGHHLLRRGDRRRHGRRAVERAETSAAERRRVNPRAAGVLDANDARDSAPVSPRRHRRYVRVSTCDALGKRRRRPSGGARTSE